MSALIDDMRVEMTPPPICKMCKILEELEPDEAEYMRQALANGVSIRMVSRVLTRNGHKIGPEPITRHVMKGHK